MKVNELDADGMEKNQDNASGRRRILKVMAIGGGAAATMLLPDRWIRPTVEAGELPAHAQGSISYSLVAGADQPSGALCWIENITVTMSPPVSGVMIHATINGTGAVAPPDASTNGSGVAGFPDIAVAQSGTFSIVFSFADSATYGPATATLGPFQQGSC